MTAVRLLLEVTVFSAVLFALILLVKRLFRRQFSPSLQYFIWFLLIARLVFPFTVQSGFSFITLPQPTATAWVEEDSSTPAETQPQEDAADRYTPAASQPSSNTEATEPADAVQQKAEAKAPAVQIAAPLPQMPPAEPSVSLGDALLWLWLAGAAFLSCRTAVHYHSLSRRIRRGSLLPTAEIRKVVDEVRRELGIRRNLRVVLQTSIDTPALTASLHPRLLLPVSILDDPEELRFAVRHELTHFKRGDYAVCCLMIALRIIYWFNPIVWLMQQPLKTDMEAACDNMAAAALPLSEKKEYACTVLRMFSQRRRPQLVLGMSLQNNKKTAEKRIRGIFMKNKTRVGIKFVCILVAAVLGVVCFTTACQPAMEVYPGISESRRFKAGTLVAGVDVGGMTFEEGKTAVLPAADQLLDNQVSYTVEGVESPYTHSLSELGASVDVLPALAAAMQQGGEGTSFPVEISVDQAQLRAAVSGDSVNWNQPSAAFTVEQARDEATLTTSGRIEALPPGTSFRVDTEALIKQIRQQIETQSFAPFAAPGSQAAATTDGTEPVLMGEYETGFSSSAGSRRYNIWKAADRLNGVTIEPGETWSMNEATGPRLYSEGWQGAPGISDGEYKEQPGGGISQVASTLYGAALRAELVIQDRTPSAWPVAYVPGGLDAAVSDGGPDLKLKNGYDTPIYIVVQCDGTDTMTLWVQIYGPGFADGLTRDFASQLTKTFGGGETTYIDDPSLPVGTEETIIMEHPGKEYQVVKYYDDADGNHVREENFSVETYDYVPAKVRRGADGGENPSIQPAMPSAESSPDAPVLPVSPPLPSAEPSDAPSEAPALPALPPLPSAEPSTAA